MFNTAAFDNSERRDRIASELFGAFGENSFISPPFFCDYGSHIHIGANVEINFGFIALDCNRIEIGDNTLIGPNVQLYASTHPLQAEYRREQMGTRGAVHNRPQCLARWWRDRLRRGHDRRKHGDRRGIGVVENIPPNVVAWGNPAKVQHGINEQP